MKIGDLTDKITGLNVSDKSLIGFFNVEMLNGHYRLLTNRCLYIIGQAAANPDYYFNYTVLEGDHWSLLAYKNYESVDLWWIICKFNAVVDPSISPIPGTVLKMPTRDFVDYVVEAMKS